MESFQKFSFVTLDQNFGIKFIKTLELAPSVKFVTQNLFFPFFRYVTVDQLCNDDKKKEPKIQIF